ncbi:hypothetical protein TWF192_006670 [Orbilia oligospora]|uniref:Phospholipid metabolism enzyme regulator n=2 Tax=Orbilia oligospora TaxID=2813651 RepID=A0A6G1M5S8_ORBOL|nr:hypothetical protein TWF679_010538 [Orbilia oligospora]KAF3227236.1 hypothetical protein TWF191_004101 [Orbilia oligospora]KAF3246854.1 hypothetical protein TWF192_006670 [Orbilia oligospora]
MSRNSSATNLRKETSTPNSLVEFPQPGDRGPNVNLAAQISSSSTPGVPSRTSSPVITPTLQQTPPKHRRVSAARETRREASPSPARSLSSTSIARLANSAASQSSPAVAQAPTSGTTANQQPAMTTEPPQPLSPRPQRPIHPNVPHWPTSPRLSLARSPPPMNRSSSLTSPRRLPDSTLTLPPPSMAVRGRESPGRGPSGDESHEGSSSYFHSHGQRPPRPIASPALLETVTESSLPSTPAIGMGERGIDARLLEAEQRRQETSSMSTRPSESSIASSRTTTQESESDTGNLSDRKPASRAPSRAVSRRPTVTSGPLAQDVSGGLTPEIETVTSIPQQMNPPATVRLSKKASQETIRPAKKEKRKKAKRVPGPGAQTTKADIFEQRINDTLDDAESSDSEETFVYESNPAEKTRPRHSRTSSVTSLSDPRSQALNTQGRTRRNMKFGTGHAYKSQPPDDYYTSDGVGSSSIRGVGSQSGLRSHIGRGYTNPNLDDSSGPQLTRYAQHKSSHQSLRTPHHISSSRASSRPGSPRTYGNKHTGGNGSTAPKARREGSHLSMYEGDIEGDADERTPLWPLNRNGVTKSRPGSVNSHRRDRDYGQRNWYTRLACCIFAVFAMVSLVACSLGFVFLTTKPLQDVKLINITDVIATKQEMMFNMDIFALNPNILPVSIATMDVNVFIKSPYVKDKPKKDKPKDDIDGGDKEEAWWKNVLRGNLGAKIQRRRPNMEKPQHNLLDDQSVRALDGVDKGTDPISDPAEEEETMLLGRIFNFDSALTFDGSPFRQEPAHAIGEVRLSKPGNKTEVGGSERWERAMVHTFDLTIRGFLRYQLPLSGRVRTATIQGTVTVHPNEDAADGFREHVGSGSEFHDNDAPK